MACRCIEAQVSLVHFRRRMLGEIKKLTGYIDNQPTGFFVDFNSPTQTVESELA